MPKAFTRAQVARILTVDGKPVIDPALFGGKRPPQVAAAWMVRRLMDWEDRAVLEQARVFQAFKRRIARRASALAERYGLDKLEASAAGVRWQRALVEAVEADAGRVYEALAAHAFDSAMTAYYASYYGRAWVLSEAMVEGAPVQVPAPDPERAAERVIIPVLKEAGPVKARPQQQAEMIYDLLGRQWRAEFGNQQTALIDGIMRSLNASLAQGQSVPAAMQGVANVRGVNIDRRLGAPTATRLTRLGLPGPRQYSAGTFRQNFNRVQTITRSYINEADNAGALALYRENADTIGAVMWKTSMRNSCPDCVGLDGQTWDVNDPAILRPVIDTHPNCNCRLVSIPRAEYALPALYAEDSPRSTLWDYVGAIAGAAALLSAFKTGAGAPVGSDEDWWNEELEAEFWN